jgi:hypothetical protein
MTKFAAADLTGSAAMLQRGDPLHGGQRQPASPAARMRRAARPANTRHPFGHGLQLYFWTFAVAVLIFGAGAGGFPSWKTSAKIHETATMRAEPMPPDSLAGAVLAVADFRRIWRGRLKQ